MLIFISQSRNAAQILKDVPPLARRRKIPARRGRGDRAGRVVAVGVLERGIVVEIVAIGANLLTVSVSADIVVVIGFRNAFRQTLVYRP